MQSSDRRKQGIFAMRRWIGRLTAALVAVAGVALLPATQALAVISPITVTVNADITPSDHLEGVSYSNWGSTITPLPIASFSDSDACPTTCQPFSDYTATVLWGDSTATTTCPSVSCTITFASSNLTTGTYDVNASHTYKDEFNCRPTPCANYPVHVSVRYTFGVVGPMSANKFGADGIAIKDQVLCPSASLFS